MPLRISGLVGVAMILASAEAINDGASVDVWLRLMEFGCLGAFCWYGIARMVPRMLSDFRRETALSREHYSSLIDKLVDRMESDRAAERETLHKMIRHCASRGNVVEEE